MRFQQTINHLPIPFWTRFMSLYVLFHNHVQIRILFPDLQIFKILWKVLIFSKSSLQDASNKVSMSSVPIIAKRIFAFFLIASNGHLPHFCPTFNMAVLLPKRSIGGCAWLTSDTYPLTKKPEFEVHLVVISDSWWCYYFSFKNRMPNESTLCMVISFKTRVSLNFHPKYVLSFWEKILYSILVRDKERFEIEGVRDRESQL